jgi:uncharacterized protein YgbK (DUF1537 family)
MMRAICVHQRSSAVPSLLNDLLISFYGDDFTGSTDAMESLARSGVRTVLFTEPPSPQMLAKYPGIGAFGVAGLTRSKSPDEMEAILRPVFAALKESGAPIVHYKVCSTFDSSPTVGSIGRVIDIGVDIFGARFIPVVVGAPSLGRHCVFGNLFARAGTESEPFRLDRHPSMSKHPTTPMDEADLRLLLAKQTLLPIGLFDILEVERSDASRKFDKFRTTCPVGLVDLLYESQLATVGALLDRCDEPLFVVGSSGVEAALCAHWQRTGRIAGAARFEALCSVGPIVAVCGSCSPVTARQIQWAVEQGFAEIAINPLQVDQRKAIASAIDALGLGRSVVIHTGKPDAKLSDLLGGASELIGVQLGLLVRQVLEEARPKRVIIAGGDTSGQIAGVLGIKSLEMIAELTRGAPLCRATAPGSSADGIEIIFKGGQIGPVDFFGLVQRGQ